MEHSIVFHPRTSLQAIAAYCANHKVVVHIHWMLKGEELLPVCTVSSETEHTLEAVHAH